LVTRRSPCMPARTRSRVQSVHPHLDVRP
jgi:hypothetical protein